MDRLKALIREPALLLDAFESVVVFAVAVGLLGLSGDQQTNLIAVFIALLAVAKGVLTKPFPVMVLADFGRALLVFCVSLGVLNLTADQVTITATMLGTVLTVVARGQITPRYDPVVEAAGAGAGPVRNDIGSAAPLYIAGVVLIVLGVIALLLLALGDPIVSLVWAILIVILGVVLCVVSSRTRY